MRTFPLILYVILISAILSSSFTCKIALAETVGTDTTISAPAEDLLKLQTASFDESPKLNVLPQSPSNKIIGPIYLKRIIPIILETAIDSRSVKVGDIVFSKLKEDLYYGRQLIAPAGSLASGRIISYRNGRTLSEATFNNVDRFKSNASIEIAFENIYSNEECIISINGKPAHQEQMHCEADGFVHGITVDQTGKIVQGGLRLSPDQKHIANALRVVNYIPLPGGLLFNMAMGSIVMGTIGAACPDIVLNKPIDSSVSHERLKGVGYGVASNLPGAFIVTSMIEKGREIVLRKGDELMIDISITNQSVPLKERDLVVQAKLLNDENKSLPLKPFIESPMP
jgi:hypothetical protein